MPIKPETGGSGRVSQTAPRSKSLGEQEWAKAMRSPRFRKALEDGHKAADEGRVSTWAQVKKRLGL
jgi:hypothetical protein